MVEKTMTPATKTSGALQRWDPFGLLETLEQDFEHLWHWPFFMRASPLAMTLPAYMPRTDMFEKDGMLVFKVELPGLTKEDVQVELEGGELVVKGESKAEKETKEAAYYRMERKYGSFYRRLPVPPDVKPEEITAVLTDGVLEVHIPKPVTPKPETTKIPIA